MARTRPVLPLLFATVAGCGSSSGTTCKVDSDCAATEVCEGASAADEGSCTAFTIPASGCATTADCIGGLVCQGASASARGSCVTPTGAVSCAVDYDCAVGNVCQGASASARGTCAAAGTAARTFGSVSLDFTAGTEVWLVSVMSVPVAVAADSTGDIPYQLTGVGAGAAALRFSAAPRLRLSPADKRLAFDRLRHESVARIAARYATLAPAEVGALASAATGCASDCGTTQMCWQGACTASPSVAFLAPSNKITCNLVDVVDAGGTKVNVLVDAAAGATAADQAKAAVRKFASTFATELGFLGTAHAGAVDRDGDGRFTVVFTNAVSGVVDLDIVGFFEFKDFLPTTDPEATGNVADLLWSRLPGSSNAQGTITPDLAAGTLAHEYTHLTSYAVRVQAGHLPPEALWLDEGLAHLMEDLTGWGASNVANVAKAFERWNEATLAGSEDSGEQRGKAYLLLRHLIDQGGLSAHALVSSLLRERDTGLTHEVFRSGGAPALWHWQAASYATNNPDVTQSAARAWSFAAPTTSPVTGYKMGISPFGSFLDARGDTVTLTGPTVPDVDGPTTAGPFTDGSVVHGATQLFVVTGGTGKVTLAGSTTQPSFDLHVDAVRVK